MNDLTISKELIIPNLTPGEIMLLKLIYDQNKRLFKHFFITYSNYVPTILKTLENKLYIKNTGEEFEDITLRKKAEDLFKVDSIEQSVTNIIEYLNNKLNKPRGFSIKSKGNRRYISARLKEGYSEVDLKAVIDVKYDEWSGTSQEFYLRPATLFNDEKCQSYLLQVGNSEEKSIDINIEKA